MTIPDVRVTPYHTRVISYHTRVISHHTRVISYHIRVISHHTRVISCHTVPDMGNTVPDTGHTVLHTGHTINIGTSPRLSTLPTTRNPRYMKNGSKCHRNCLAYICTNTVQSYVTMRCPTERCTLTTSDTPHARPKTPTNLTLTQKPSYDLHLWKVSSQSHE